MSKIDDYNVYRWKEGLYCFRNKPFADIIKDLEKYYDLKDVYKRQAVICPQWIAYRLSWCVTAFQIYNFGSYITEIGSDRIAPVSYTHLLV